MAYIGIDNAARKMTKLYIGVNNTARKVVKAYVGDADNVARLWLETTSTPGDNTGGSGNTGIIPGVMDYGGTWYKSSVPKSQITYIEFHDYYTPPTGGIDEVWYGDSFGDICCCRIGSELHIWNYFTQKVAAHPNSRGMFKGFKNCKYIEGLFYLDVSQVEDMMEFFADCESLLDLSLSTCQWDTSKVLHMGLMFSNCKSLESLFITSWNDTSKVITMDQMFSNCTSLHSLTLGFSTQSAINMSYMFVSCVSLQYIFVKQGLWSTAQADAGYMFLNCGTSSVRFYN